MNYTETLDYLFSRLPMFQRTGPAAYKGSLDNTIALCDFLGNPQNEFKTIHIAGTNGKGSCSHLIASILQESGLKTGLYTSPHMKDFRERIKINGKEISQDYVIEFVEQNKIKFEEIHPSFFEMTVALAFNYFADNNVDIAVIETGLGGRLDSTNIITPLLSVITNISNDHSALLGDTLEKIAAEKAGIIKHGIPIIIGETQNEIKHVFNEKANLLSAPILYAEDEGKIHSIEKIAGIEPVMKLNISFGPKFYKNISCPLTGNYQTKNLVTAITAINHLSDNHFQIKDEAIHKGIQKVIENTGLMGRWQILSTNPLSICDAAHNEAGLAIVIEQIKQIPYKNLHIILGVVADKDIENILKLFPTKASYYFCKADIPRAMEAQDLQEKALKYGLTGTVFISVKQAFKIATEKAEKDDLIFIGGSTFVVAEVV
ncbi:MAG: bifunctional folylpolyglutamate synthase/dihydrofolate synthase [Bacteroidetes bacterium]|nr:bifunctional folylpolyglutamate synthase/dihydrofolate synthase [Bacteroidota bacterium]HET6245993.1 Mur ligase family protein [Bacteroidia bacterium]